jgi:hypothetical protein
LNLDPNSPSDWQRVETDLRSEDPKLFELPPQPSAVNKAETAKQVALLRQMRKLTAERGLDLAKRSDFELTESLAKQELEKKEPITVHISFAKQHDTRFTYVDLITEYLSERGLADTSENREAARKFFVALAEKRGMLKMDPALLRMNDLNYENYRIITGQFSYHGRSVSTLRLDVESKTPIGPSLNWLPACNTKYKELCSRRYEVMALYMKFVC